MVRGISLFYKGKSSFFRRVTLITSILSLVFISLFWLVILVAEDQMEVISLDHWLDAEARMFERDYQLQGLRLIYLITMNLTATGVKSLCHSG